MSKEIYKKSHSIEDFVRNWEGRLNEFDRKRIDYIKSQLNPYREKLRSELYKLKGLQDQTSVRTFQFLKELVFWMENSDKYSQGLDFNLAVRKYNACLNYFKHGQ